MPSSSATGPRRRMSGEARRAQIKLVAQHEFATGGYQGTTTVDVARAAGLSEALVLKHFGSKGALFEEAVVEPVLELLDRIRDENLARAASTERKSPADDMARLHEHLTELATFVRDHRGLLLTLLAEIRTFPAAAARLATVLESHVADLSSSAALLVGTGQYEQFDTRLLTYLSLSAAVLTGCLDDDPDESTKQIVEALFVGLLSNRGRADVARSRRKAEGKPRRSTT